MYKIVLLYSFWLCALEGILSQSA